MGNFTDWLRDAGITLTVFITVWAILKDKIAAELAPKLELYFQTKLRASQQWEAHQNDHRTLESRIPEIAKAEATTVTQPLIDRISVNEGATSRLELTLERIRVESREDFGKVFDTLEKLSISVASLGTKKDNNA